MQPKPCMIICNTKWGYCMHPVECNSIAEAIRYARETGIAYRIFDKKTKKLIRKGWIL